MNLLFLEGRSGEAPQSAPPVSAGRRAAAMVSESPRPGARVPWRRSDEALRVNVGGVRRRLSARALARFPGTRLGRLQAAASEEQARRLCDDYDPAAREFYFDRHPGFFLGLLHFYRTGHLHVLDELCVFAFGQEADYWGLGESALATCCRARYLERRVARPRAWDEDSDTPSSVDPCPGEISDVQRELARYGAARCGRLRRRLWLTMENPGYSLPSKLFSCVSIGVVLASIAAMCIHSLPEYQAREAAAALAAVAAGRSAEDVRDDPVLRRLEYFCIAWFSFEVSSRLLLAPSTRNFFCHPLNLIDIVSVLPFYLTLVAGAALGDQGGASGEELGDLGKVVQVFRLMRIFRVLKLARHSTGLRSLGATLKVTGPLRPSWESGGECSRQAGQVNLQACCVQAYGELKSCPLCQAQVSMLRPVPPFQQPCKEGLPVISLSQGRKLRQRFEGEGKGEKVRELEGEKERKRRPKVTFDLSVEHQIVHSTKIRKARH